MAQLSPAAAGERIAIVAKGYPRLSETFIAQEILGLEERGVRLEIWSLRHPTDRLTHPMHRQIAARVTYLPEYLIGEPLRVLRGWLSGLREPGFRRGAAAFWRDLVRDPTPNRIRRFGQALVMARELAPDIRHIHAHYLHTPASVVRYAALLSGRSWSFSAHAKDIWTIPDWEMRDKLDGAAWGVTCTAEGHRRLSEAAPDPHRVRLLYHGLDLGRFPDPPEVRPSRDGSRADDPVRIVSVGRMVEKKGFDDLLRALAGLPPDLHWRFAHVGGGQLARDLQALATGLGIAERVAFMGSMAQPEIVTLLRDADIFALPSKEAASGDRDGLPNVIMEAASQALAIVATRFAGIPEFVRENHDGILVPPGDWEALSNAINLVARDPVRRGAFGASAYRRLVEDFGAGAGFDWLAARFLRSRESDAQETPKAAAATL